MVEYMKGNQRIPSEGVVDDRNTSDSQLTGSAGEAKLSKISQLHYNKYIRD